MRSFSEDLIVWSPLRSLTLAVAVFGPLAAEVRAQQVTVSAPFHSVNEGFFEQIGANWGFNANGISFRFGSPNITAPQFGQFNPGAGITTGFAFGRPGGTNGFFNLAAAQGFRQSLVTQTPMLTLTNGLPGYFGDASVSPFVVSYVPVVGGFPAVGFVQPAMPPPLVPVGPDGVPLASRQWPQQSTGKMPVAHERENAGRMPVPQGADPAAAVGDRLAVAQGSSAGRAVPGVALARQLHQQEQAAQNQELQAVFQRGVMAEEDGKPRLAKVYYEIVLRRGSGELRERAQAKLAELRATAEPSELPDER